MPELIRSVVSRARMYFKNRRQAPRLRVRLSFSLSLVRSAKISGRAGDRTLKGHTRDISASGLALLLPQVHLDGHHLAADGKKLRLTVEVAGGAMSMLVVPRRYERLENAELGCAYLIGAEIVEIEDDDRMRFENFISRGLNDHSHDANSQVS